MLWTQCRVEWRLTPGPQPLQLLLSPMPLDPTALQASQALSQMLPLLQVHVLSSRQAAADMSMTSTESHAPHRGLRQLIWFCAGSAASSAASAAGANSTAEAAVQASAVSAIGAVAAASVRLNADQSLSEVFLVAGAYGLQ